MQSSFLKASLITFVLSFAQVTHAGLIHGGSDIIDHDDLLQLGTWLGEDIDLTNIFTKTTGMTSADWHAAVDNQGRTFTLIEAETAGVSYVFGGYNAYNWLSNIGYRNVSPLLDTSFLFSITNNVKITHNQLTFSTFNNINYGATFGGGHDLYINRDLSGGYSNLGHTYGDVTRYRDPVYQSLLAGSYDNWSIKKYESFTVSAATEHIPEPGTLTIFALGLLSLITRLSTQR